MKALALILLFCSVAHAGIGRRFTIDNLDDLSKGEEMALAFNENLDDLLRDKVNRSTNTYGGRTFTFTNLADPNLAEQNSIAANKEIDDAWANLVDISSISSLRKYSADFVNDLEQTAFILNENIDDLWREKRDR